MISIIIAESDADQIFQFDVYIILGFQQRNATTCVLHKVKIIGQPAIEFSDDHALDEL